MGCTFRRNQGSEKCMSRKASESNHWNMSSHRGRESENVWNRFKVKRRKTWNKSNCENCEEGVLELFLTKLQKNQTCFWQIQKYYPCVFDNTRV